jgi:acyl dehydratase
MALFSSLASRVFYPRLVLVAGKGIDRLRFPHPVRSEAVLRGSADIVKIVRHALWADVHYLSTMVDLDGNVVLSYVGIVVVSCRET